MAEQKPKILGGYRENGRLVPVQTTCCLADASVPGNDRLFDEKLLAGKITCLGCGEAVVGYAGLHDLQEIRGAQRCE